MRTVEEIEKAIEQLSPKDLARFRAWLEIFEADHFDLVVEQGVRAGRLDTFAEEALAAYRSGQSETV